MLQPLILSAFLLVVAFLQPAYPSLENLPPITVQNASSLKQVAAIGSDTLDNVLWSPDGKTLAVVTSGQVILYKVDDLKSAFRTITHQANERVSFEDDRQLNVGNAIWDIQKGTSETKPSGFFQRSPSGRLEVTSKTDGKQTIVTINDNRRTKPMQLMTETIGYLNGVLFSPDEQFAVLKFAPAPDPDGGYGYELAQLWNVDTGTLVAALDQALEYIGLIKFHANGNLIVTTSGTDAAYGSIFEDVRVWDGHIGKQIKSDGAITYLPVQFSPDQQLMVFASNAGLSLWNDHPIGYLNYEFPNPDRSQITKPLFSPDGKNLLAQSDGQILVWDTDAAIQLGKPRFILNNGGQSITDYFFNQNGKRLVVLTDDNKIRIWDFTQPTPTIIQVINDLPRAAISPDAKWIWGYSYSTSTHILIDATTGERLSAFPSNAQIDPLWKYIAYRTEESVNVIDLAQNVSVSLNPLPNYLGSAHYFDVKNGQVLFVTPGINHMLQNYDLQTGELLFNHQEYSSADYRLSSDGESLLSIDKDSDTSVTIRETTHLDTNFFSLDIEGKKAEFLLLPKQETLAFINPKLDIYAPSSSRSSYSQLELWNTATGEQSAAWTITGRLGTFALNKDGHLLAIGSDDFRSASLTLIDLNPPQTKPITIELPSAPNLVMGQMDFSSDDKYLAVSLDDQMLGDGPAIHSYAVFVFNIKQLLEPTNAQPQPPLLLPDVQSPMFSPNNQFLLAYKPSDNFRDEGKPEFELWSVEESSKRNSFAGDGIATFSPNSALLAVHNRTYTEVYSTNALAAGDTKPLITIPDNEGRVKDLAFSADGKMLYLIEEARVRIYGVP